MQGRVAATERHPLRVALEFPHSLDDLRGEQALRGRAYRRRIDGVHGVAPRTAVVASAKADEVRRQSRLGPLALDRRAEDLDDGMRALALTHRYATGSDRRHAACASG